MKSTPTPDTSPRRASAVPDDPVLADLIAELTNRLEAGEPVDLEDYIGRYPEQAEPLRQLWPALRMMADLGESAVGGSSRADRPRTGDVAGPGVLGDFRLLREVGRGGMGVVYEAEQLSLGRRVALKILPMAAALDPRQLQRFRVEAQAAACLHHTHIVPVHAVGAEHGVPFYAMQFIEGRSLAQLIAELRRLEGLDAADADAAAPDLAAITTTTLAGRLLSAGAEGRPAEAGSDSPTAALPSPLGGEGGPQGRMRGIPDGQEPPTKSPSSTSTRNRDYIQSAARLGLEAAEALDHAHTRGILHRDIKPGNLLVDAEGRLWVTDFGLAQIQGNPGLTLSSDILGTLRYMSPEQALGKRVVIDGRTDVYSLGVTLYELLTLRSAFDGKDRAEILRKIADREPPPPREANPAVPRDLETIILKAMAKEPAERYATAKDLADDLSLYLEGRPIRARRPSLLDRSAKWVKRHKAAVAVAALVVILALVGLTTSTILIAGQRAEVVRQRDLARRAVDEMYTQVAEKWLRDQPALTTLQRDFLEKALAFYEQFASETGSDAKVRSEAVRALQRVGAIRETLGQHAEAETALRRAVALGSELARQYPDRPEFRLLLAESRLGLAKLLRTVGKPFEAEMAVRFHFSRGDMEFESPPRVKKVIEAEQQVRQANSELAALRTSIPAAPESRRRSADVNEALCNELTFARQLPEAEAAVQAAFGIRQSLVKDFPDDVEYRLGLAENYSSQGMHFMWWGLQTDKAMAALQQAESLLSKLRSERPGDPRFRSVLSGVLTNLGVLQSWGEKWAEAEELDRRVLTLAEGLVADFPEVLKYQEGLALSLNNLAGPLFEQGKYAESERLHRRELSIREALSERHPDIPDYEDMLERSLLSLSNVMCYQGKIEEARPLIQRAILRARSYLETHPKGRVPLGNALYNLVPVEAALGNNEAAVQAAEEWVGWIRGLLTGDSSAKAFVHKLVDLLWPAEPARVANHSPRWREAIDRGKYPLCKALIHELSLREPKDHALLDTLADSLSTAPEALRDPELALRFAKRACELEPDSGMSLQSLGWARYRLGDWKGCIASLSEKDDMHLLFLAMAYWQLGNKMKARELFERAVKALAGYEERCKEREKKGQYTWPLPAMLRQIRAEAAALLGASGPSPAEGESPKQSTQSR